MQLLGLSANISVKEFISNFQYVAFRINTNIFTYGVIIKSVFVGLLLHHPQLPLWRHSIFVCMNSRRIWCERKNVVLFINKGARVDTLISSSRSWTRSNRTWHFIDNVSIKGFEWLSRCLSAHLRAIWFSRWYVNRSHGQFIWGRDKPHATLSIWINKNAFVLVFFYNFLALQRKMLLWCYQGKDNSQFYFWPKTCASILYM